jgi:NIPSNAP protein
MRIAVFRVAVGVALVAAGYVAGRLDGFEPVARAQGAPAGRVFEMRTYTTNEGKLPTLHTRFRDHTMKFFTKYNMTNIGYWTPQEGPLAQNTLIYIIAHESREAAKANWAKFQADPDWVKVRTESEVNGKILVKSPDSVFLVPTDYSPIK